jgi:ABC-type transporter Mla subunit MlaD
MDTERTMEFILEQMARVDAQLARVDGQIERNNEQIAQLLAVQRSQQQMISTFLDTVKLNEQRFAVIFENLNHHHDRINTLTTRVDELGPSRH